MTAEEWARHKIARLARGQAVPLYGDEEWLALAEDDPLRFASVLQSAEAARRHRSREQVVADLIAQQQLIDRLLLERVRSASWDVAGARDWRALAMTPTYDELAERRRYTGVA